MKRIILIRHAQAEDPLISQKDFDRPLTIKGVSDAMHQATKTPMDGYVHLYHSASQRTSETARAFANHFQKIQLHSRKDLYNADLNQLLEILEELWEQEQIILVAHNPGITQLYFHLTGEWDAFEPCTCAELLFSNPNPLDNLKSSAQTIYFAHPQS